MVRLGIIGTGRIAHRFVPEAKAVEGITIQTVYNPNKESAARFAKEYSISEGTDNLEEFAGQVDAVYIASPHESHYEYAKKMISRQIHVLCEKPLALCGPEARELYELSDRFRCILMEAVKTAYCPGYLAMIELARSGVIGSIRDVEACFSKLTPTNVRELTDEKFGGSFIELGIYPMLPIFQLLGTDFREVRFRSLLSGNGLDAYTKAEFVYKEACGLAKAGLLVKSEGQLVIAGTKGYILAKSPWWLTKEFEVRFEDSAIIDFHTYEYKGTGMCYEIDAFVKSIEGEAPLKIKPEESIRMAETMEMFIEQNNRESRKNNQEDASKDKRNLKIWAHRGMSYLYPENTLEAFEAAAKLAGITGIEMDVQLTRDGHVVVIHDELVDRTTDAVGMVKDYTLQEIKRLKIKGAGVYKSGTQGYGTIPTLRETLVLLKPYCLKNGLLINIELKNSKVRYDGMEEKVLELVEEYDLHSYVWYSSFLPESAAAIKRLRPEVKTGVLARLLEDCMTYAKEVGADALHPYTGGLNVTLPECMKHMPVRAWNCEELFFGQKGEFRENNLTQYERYGVTDVFTNVPERYLE